MLAQNSSEAKLTGGVEYPPLGRPLASPELVHDTQNWLIQVQSSSDRAYLKWCWYSTRHSQAALDQVDTYNQIKTLASVWLAMIRSGPDNWWLELVGTEDSLVETWAIALGDARFGRTLPLEHWFTNAYAVSAPRSKSLQIFWELSLLALRELLHSDVIQKALWPMFKDTLTHEGHVPENLPLRIIPDLVKNCESAIPDEFWIWFHQPLFPQALPYEKHIRPGTWSILWHAWMPTSWRHQIALALVELLENAFASGQQFKLPDDLRTLWHAGPSFDPPTNILLALAMLIQPRVKTYNAWSHEETEHWLDDVEHFYPDAHFLRTFYIQLDGLTVEVARAWLLQRAYPATSSVTIPGSDLLDAVMIATAS